MMCRKGPVAVLCPEEAPGLAVILSQVAGSRLPPPPGAAKLWVQKQRRQLGRKEPLRGEKDTFPPLKQKPREPSVATEFWVGASRFLDHSRVRSTLSGSLCQAKVMTNGGKEGDSSEPGQL